MWDLLIDLLYKETKFVPNPSVGLALDYFSQRLYWADAELSVIGSVCLDGSDPRVVINGKQGMLNNLMIMFVWSFYLASLSNVFGYEMQQHNILDHFNTK